MEWRLARVGPAPIVCIVDRNMRLSLGIRWVPSSHGSLSVFGAKCSSSTKNWSKAAALRAELVRGAAARAPERLSGRRLGRRYLLSNAGSGGCEVLGRLLTYHARRAEQGSRGGQQRPGTPWLEVEVAEALVESLSEMSR